VRAGQFREEAELQEGLRHWISAHPDLIPGAVPGGSPLDITSLSHAEGGMANETLMVEFLGEHPGIVVRLPPLVPTFETYDFRTQATVQNAVAAAGLPAPSPTLAVTDTRWIGCPFLVMPMVRGNIPGPAPVFDPWITGPGLVRQRKIHDGLIDTLVAVHAVDWKAQDLGRELPGPTLDEALQYWTDYVRWAGEGEPLPELSDALDWCRRHQPSEIEAPGWNAVLLWGDARLGNLVFDDRCDVHAILDWDLAALGPREMDLGWFFGLEFMMEELFGQRVPGFPQKREGLARYEALSGHTVNHMGWHEVFALARALAINDRHQRMARSARRGDNPMREILRARIESVESGDS
jgi:aminoglycoside phosphotransferase (APT) family kinase protein